MHWISLAEIFEQEIHITYHDDDSDLLSSQDILELYAVVYESQIFNINWYKYFLITWLTCRPW